MEKSDLKAYAIGNGAVFQRAEKSGKRGERVSARR
jgi:hypothetical protein